MPFRQGDVYWLKDCPPLSGGVKKDRPVIILDDDDPDEKAISVLVVATTTKDKVKDPGLTYIKMPFGPGLFPEECSVVVQWELLVKPENLRVFMFNLIDHDCRTFTNVVTAVNDFIESRQATPPEKARKIPPGSKKK